MSFYAPLQATAARLIADKGQDVTLRRAAGSAYSPITGTVAVTYSDFTVKGVVTNYRSNEVDGTKVQRGDKRVLMTDEPLIDDLIVIKTVAHKVVDVEVVSPAGEDVLYKAQVRK